MNVLSGATWTLATARVDSSAEGRVGGRFVVCTHFVYIDRSNLNRCEMNTERIMTRVVAGGVHRRSVQKSNASGRWRHVMQTLNKLVQQRVVVKTGRSKMEQRKQHSSVDVHPMMTVTIPDRYGLFNTTLYSPTLTTSISASTH